MAKTKLPISWNARNRFRFELTMNNDDNYNDDTDDNDNSKMILNFNCAVPTRMVA